MIRLLLVADIRLYQEALAQILAREGRLHVAAVAADAPAAVQLARQGAIDVALVDVAMSQSIAAIREIAPHAKVVAIAMRESEADFVACAEAGIAGYVPRAGSVEDLIKVLESVARGELLCSPRSAAALLRRVATLAAGRPGRDSIGPGLTPREREIGALLEAGLSNKDIAVRLGIEVATVKNHVHNLLEKLQVHRRAMAVARLQGGMRRATPVP